jgi:hypothetical protein
MERRRAMKLAAGIFAGGGIGLLTLSHAFKPKKPPVREPYKLDYTQTETEWKYVPLAPAVTAERAYTYYSEGSCMYATIKSVISQLTEKIGEPYTSFPFQMFKYGHGGIGGYGSICGTLNGAAALIGLLVQDKNVQDKMIADIFKWYEKEPLPEFNPKNPSYDYVPVKSVSNSVLCHASNTIWCKSAGFKVDSKERKERCRRLTADVAQKVTAALNDLTHNTYITDIHNDQEVNSCMVCHGSEGKVNNASAKMSCNSCHSESPGHRVFSDIHYKLMKRP